MNRQIKLYKILPKEIFLSKNFDVLQAGTAPLLKLFGRELITPEITKALFGTSIQQEFVEHGKLAKLLTQFEHQTGWSDDWFPATWSSHLLPSLSPGAGFHVRLQVVLVKFHSAEIVVVKINRRVGNSIESKYIFKGE